MPPGTDRDASSTRSLPPKGSFGWILLERGLLSATQLERAVERQRERQDQGDFARLGHVLVEMGFLTPAQVREVLQAQAIVILTCEACSSQFNIEGYSPKFRYSCPSCRGALQEADALQNVAVQDQLEVGQDPNDTARLTRPGDSNTAKIRWLKRLGGYEILGELARGGMGIVYKARQVELDRIVALKTIRQEELDSESGAADSFLREARALAGLRHPNIVAVHDVGSHQGIDYFSMGFIEGLPLDKHMQRHALAPREAAEIILQVAEAMAYAHGQGVVHRDIKPANVMYEASSRTPFLIDFGIAKRLEGPRKQYDEEEDLLGSIPYMAPEYVEGLAYDELCDLYSLGVVFYELIAGIDALPYFDEDTRRFLEQIVTGEPRPLTDWAPGIDPELDRIVQRMIAKRDRRFDSMRAVANALRRWLLEDSGQAQRAGVEARLGAAAATPPPQAPLEPAPAPGARGRSEPPQTAPGPLAGAATSRAAEPAPEASRAAQAPQAPPESAPARARPAARISPAALALGAVAAAALLGMLWTRAELDRLREAVAAQQAELSRRSADEQCRMAQEQARRLLELGQQQAALDVCSQQIERHRGSGAAAVADLLRLRGELRAALGLPGADEDLADAERLAAGDDHSR